MIMFWFLAAVLIAIALVFLLRPLRLDSTISDVDRAAQNVEIAKERLNELKIEFKDGLISEEEYKQTQEELELSLLNDVEQPAQNIPAVSNARSYNRLAQIALIIVVPVLAVIVYGFLGSPGLVEGAKKQAATGHPSASGNTQLGSVEDMVDKLAERLKNEPDNAEGWFMLGRSYMSMGRYAEAANAFQQVQQLVGDDPELAIPGAGCTRRGAERHLV